MKDRLLVIQYEGKEKRIPLNKERIVLGRDADCDFVLNGNEFSRHHISIHFKFDTVYIENVSSGGELLIGNKATEYAELRQGVEVAVGSYILKWTYGEVEANAFASNPAPQTQSGVKAFNEGASLSQIKVANEHSKGSSDLLGEDSLPELEATIPANASGDLMMSKEMAEAFAEDDTVTQLGASIGMLRILSGEITGREIRLEHGKEWIVGRAKECHIAIENPKLSRHHFRIIQIAGGFRVQDLDSSYGIKINGVGIKEGPLKSFDVITAGPVEIQFMVADKSLNALPEEQINSASALPAVIHDGVAPNASSNVHNENTYVPAIANAPRNGQSFQFQKPEAPAEASVTETPVAGKEKKKTLLPKERIILLVQKFKEQPRPRQALLILIPLFILATLISLLIPGEPQKAPAPTTAAKRSTAGDVVDNAAEHADISPKYSLKSPAEKAEIQSMYAQAEEARNKGDWKRKDISFGNLSLRSSFVA